MKGKIISSVLGGVILILGVQAICTGMDRAQFNPFCDSRSFSCDLVNVAATDRNLSRLNIYVKIAFDVLQFIKTEQNYIATYEVSAAIYDEENYQIDATSENGSIKAESFELSNSFCAFCFNYLKFDLEPGQYNLEINLSDLSTHDVFKIHKKVCLKKFYDENLTVSDISFVRNIITDELGIKSFRPDISQHILDLSNKLYIYYEIYSQLKTDDRCKILLEVKDQDGKQVYRDKFSKTLCEIKSLDYAELPCSKLTQGEYLLALTVSQNSEEYKVSRPFTIRHANLPFSISNIDDAIEQLKYITDKKTINKIKQGNNEDKITKFNSFWSQIDPTPGTVTNEFMDEYYERIQYVNNLYHGFQPGWKTDMGMIYILLGPPDEVERHPFELEEKPYESWHYFQINRTFVFTDIKGFGDYRLSDRSWKTFCELR